MSTPREQLPNDIKTSAMNLTNGEKLILVMLSEIYKHLGITDGIDPKFVLSAISSGNHWGLAWKYPGVFNGVDAEPAVVHEVVSFLAMWELIESSYDKLSAKDKALVDVANPPFSKVPKFTGFSEKYDSDYIGVASFLINDLEQFTSLKGRQLNSYYARSLENYRRMFAVFETIRSSFGQLLSAEQLAAIIRAI